jgi:hypothetical protein
MGRATPRRSGDELAGVAAESAEQRVAAQLCLADVPLRQFLAEPLIPYESDSVTRLIVDTHDIGAFSPVAGLTVGGFRDWLLSYETGTPEMSALAPGLTPEMVAAVSKIMGNQDLILAARKCSVVTAFRNTLGLPGRLSVRLQPNHPTDDLRGVAASMVDGLLYGCGDAVIGVNPATDRPDVLEALLRMIDDVIRRYEIPTQGCVLSHITAQMDAMRRGAPVDLLFQSIAGTEAANASFGVTLELLAEGQAAALSLGRGTVAHNVAAEAGILIDGVPGSTIDDVSLSNIFIDYAGGGTADDARRIVPSDQAAYPEPSRLGNLSAWGMFVRHARNLSLDHVELRVAKEDLRPVVRLEDVTGMDIDHAVLPHSAGAPTFDLNDVTGLVIHNSPGLPETNRAGKIAAERL